MVGWMINPRNHPSSRVISHEARDLTIATCKDKNISQIYEIPLLFLSNIYSKRIITYEMNLVIIMVIYPKSF
jgi:hypothetical protein